MYTIPEAQHIRLLKSFATDVSADEARKRATAYLKNCGYELAQDGESLELTRGSNATAGISFSPRGWAVRAVVTLRPEGKLQVDALKHVFGIFCGTDDLPFAP